MDTRVETELDLVGAIYDAVIDPARWNDVVDRIRRHLGFQICMLAVNTMPSGNFVIGAQSNVPLPYSETIGEYGNDSIQQWGGFERLASLPPEEPMVQSQYNGAGSWIGTRFYEEWAKPQGLVDQLVVILEHNPRMLATIGFGLHESMPPIDDRQIETLRVLAPHLRRAAIISGLLDGRTRAAESFEAALTALGSAVMLVDDQMRIVYANERAETVLRDSDPLTRLNDRVVLTRELVPGQLEGAVRNAAVDAEGLQRGSGIPARRHDGSGVIIHVLPLRRRVRPSVGDRMSGDTVAAIFVAEPDSELDLPTEAIQLLYGLRPAETRVLGLIVKGLTGPEIGQVLGIAPSTVKTHTLRLFEKLGVHSRAELLRFAQESSFGPR